MCEKGEIEAVGRWMNYIVQTRPFYERNMTASTIGVPEKVVRDIAQKVIEEGVRNLTGKEQR